MTTNLQEIGPALERITPLTQLCEILPPETFFLVGGVLRDALLGQPIGDIDLVAAEDPTEIAKQFARQCNAPWFWLDEERRQSRVLVDFDGPLTFDFAPLRASTLEADLEARDFTINSLALALPGALQKNRIVDPLCGMEDLSLCTLRMSSPRAFESDPLRILKGIRHAVKLGFFLDEATSLSMVRHAWQLDAVAIERIRQEVWAILGHPAAEHGLQMLSSTSAGVQLWGEAYDRYLPEIVEAVEGCRKIWQSLLPSAPIMDAWLKAEVEQGLTREVLLLWTRAFSTIAPEFPSQLAEDWRLSRRAQSRIKALASVNESMLNELNDVAPRSRSFALWLQKRGLDAADLLLMASIDVSGATEFDQRMILSWIPLVADALDEKVADLVSGDWLTEELGMSPGPAVGEALESLRGAEISGQVTGEGEAKAFLRELCQNKD